MSFEKALAFVLQWEGGYSNHPADKGGETNKGVTHATYHAYRKEKGLPVRSVRLIEANEVRDIYYRKYWVASGCDLLPPKLALTHFDWAVNAGTNRAIRTLQQVVGTVDDGIIGPNTKKAISQKLERYTEGYLTDEYNTIRETKYRQWGSGSQRVFLQGWLNRLNSCRVACK